MGGQLRAHRGIRWTRYTFATLNFCVFWVCFGCVLGGYREVLASLRSGWLGMARDGSGSAGWAGMLRIAMSTPTVVHIACG